MQAVEQRIEDLIRRAEAAARSVSRPISARDGSVDSLTVSPSYRAADSKVATDVSAPAYTNGLNGSKHSSPYAKHSPVRTSVDDYMRQTATGLTHQYARSRSKSPYSNAGLFKGGDEMYRPDGYFSSIREEDEHPRDLAAKQADGRQIDDFVSNLAYIVRSIAKLKDRCRGVGKSYDMIDKKVLEMLRFIEAKNPVSDVVHQLRHFLQASAV